MARSRSGEIVFRASPSALIFAAALIASLFWASTPSMAETRRAFLVGIQRYNDGFIQRLNRTVNDAGDLAKDLEEHGL